MSAPEIEALASPPTTIPWVPLWPLGGVSMGELAYAENASNVAVSVTSDAAAVDVVTAPAITVDGATPIIVEFYAPGVAFPPLVGQGMVFNLWDGTTDLGRITIGSNPAAADLTIPIRAVRRLTPAAGAHTYKVKAWVSTGSGTVYSGVGGTATRMPISIRITLAAPISNAPAGALLPVQYGTSLPASPIDGQEAILVDSLTNPSYQWRFRYNAGSSSAYKWEFIGGTKASSAVNTAQTPASTSGWMNLATDGPSFTLPRAGDYLLEMAGSITTPTGGNAGWIGMALGDGTPGTSAPFYGQGAGWSGNVYLADTVTGQAAAALWKLRYTALATNVTFSGRTLRVTPVRVS